MSKDIRAIRKECCDIWNNLKDKTKMIDYLIESKQLVADLEAKLAESEKKIEKAKRTAFSHRQISDDIKIRALKTDVTNKENHIKELKQQLAEKDKKITQLEYEKILSENKPAFCTLAGKDCEVLGQLAEKDKLIEFYINSGKEQCEEINKINHRSIIKSDEIDQLKQQLAEKEQEIDNLYNRLNSKQKFYEMSLEKDYKEYLSRLDKLEKQCDKDKISFAVEKLSGVRSFISDATEIKEPDYTKVCNYIDNQIKQLKGVK